MAGFVGEAKQKVERDVKLPSGYTLTWGGTFKNLQEASARLAVAVPVALVMIFVLLHSTFNSSKLAMLIFLNVPMAATGGIFASHCGGCRSPFPRASASSHYSVWPCSTAWCS